MRSLVSLLLLVVLVCATPIDETSKVSSYDDYQVLRVLPSDEEQVETLLALEEAGAVDIWTRSRLLNAPWDFMVKPDARDAIRLAGAKSNLTWEVVIDDLGRSIKEEKERQSSHSAPLRGRSSRSYSSIGPRYMRFNEINTWMEDVARVHRSFVSLKSIGRSAEGRDIKVLHISRGSGDSKPRPAIFVDAGIHAREWIAPATALYIMEQLVENRTHTSYLTENIDWFFLPVVNPDGYEYSHTNDRMWRKTRSKTLWGLGCSGADGNRNFDFHWKETGASGIWCAETYAGSKAFSEPETRAVRDVLLANKKNIKMYITYHSYGNYLLYPWGFTHSLPKDWRTLDSVAHEANRAMVAAGSQSYTIGSSTNVLYPAAGGSDDYAKGVAGIEMAYTIELPGGNGYGFDLPASYISEVGRHQMEAMKVFAQYVENLAD